MIEKTSEKYYGCANFRRMKITVSQGQVCVYNVLKRVVGFFYRFFFSLNCKQEVTL